MKPDVRETYRIIECLHLPELLQLSDNNRELLKMFVSAVYLDLSDGSVARTALWSMFPEGSTTGDNLRDHTNGLCLPPPDPEEE
jgi:hypothetical protein